MLLFLLMLLYFPNSGGLGIALPWNLEFIGWLGLVVVVVLWRIPLRVISANRQPLITVGCLVLALPWLLQARGNPGVWVLLAGWLMWMLLQRLSITSFDKRFICAMVFILALAQSLICLIQVFLPQLAGQLYEYDWLRNHGRPYGIFQQANLLASFLATGLGCGFLLITQTTHRAGTITCCLGLSLLAFVLMINQSRAGALGAGLIILLISLFHWQSVARRIITVISMMAVCAFAGWYITHHIQILIDGVPYLIARDYDASTHERWNILSITWQMILQKPWLGWGYGTFEYTFSRYVLAHPELPYTYSSVVAHPHNELLYDWFQGGIVALVGLMMLIGGWIKMVLCAGTRGRLGISYSLLIIPLLVHLSLEFPFYLSFIHFALFIVLLRLGCPDNARTTEVTTTFRLAGLVCGALMVGYSAIGLYANHQLTHFERDKFAEFPSPVPWYFAVQLDRAEFDAMVALLIDFNQSHNQANLEQYMQRAERWSLRHNDSNVWLSMMTIAQYRGEKEKLTRMKQVYPRLFPLQKQWKAH
ncbi:Wzy polymerase domain-containing protein [Atlantibacter hermannii]|nr:Wzy polymerase domain-containing protein [Atlantibacter hermannii]